MQPFTIVGYTFKAENLCPTCTIKALPTGPGEAFDGWEDCSTPPMTVEDNLTELAAAFGIDRLSESSFDSDDFPKVIFADMVGDEDQCMACDGEMIG